MSDQELVGWIAHIKLPEEGALDELKNGPLADLLIATKDLITQAGRDVKKLESLRQQIETMLLLRMEEEGSPRLNGFSGWAGIDESDVAQINDMEELGEFCTENNAWHLFQRRLNNTAYRELLEERGGAPIPGVSTFTVRKVKTRKG